MLTVRFVDGVARVDRAQWDALVGPAGCPFLEWDFLAACEAGSALPERGMQAQHATLWDGERLLAALPLYVKGDGRGEFIYDYQWSMLANMMGVDYYPKVVSMAPFTPVPCTHLLAAPEVDRQAALGQLAGVVEDWAREVGLKGVHYLFVPEDEAHLLEGLGYVRRTTFQLALDNEGYETFDDLLARFRSKDRVKVKRELRRPAEEGLTIEVVEGEDVSPSHLAAMHTFYERTCALYGTGSNYLRPATWEALGAWRRRLVLFLARRGEQLVGGSLCVHKGDALYGRYWGSAEEVRGLYFNLACYQPARLLIERGWRRFYAGSGNAVYKYARGLEPLVTHSVHRVFDERLHATLADHVRHERPMVEEQVDELRAKGKLRRKAVEADPPD
jgi:uncharacterized protein